MIKRIRDYGKKEPSRDAHKIYVVCEGSEDEKSYFLFFEGLSSNLNVITIPSEEGRTDPLQLMARSKVLFDEETGRYSLDYKQGDRVWFVVDTDTWEDEGKIAPLRTFCAEMNERMPEKQRMLFLAIAKEGKATTVTGGQFIKKHKLNSASSVSSALKGLLDKDFITLDKNAYSVYDQFFSLWLTFKGMI